MNDQTRRCLRCDGDMQEGFVVDYDFNGRRPAKWVEGAPTPGLIYEVRLAGKQQYRISTYRCQQCGWLESFAGSPLPPEATECLRCGTVLPPNQSVCPACGWTWGTDTE